MLAVSFSIRLKLFLDKVATYRTQKHSIGSILTFKSEHYFLGERLGLLI